MKFYSQKALQVRSLIRVPSHIRITGNEHTDLAAKEALSLPEVTEVPCFPKALTGAFKALHNL